VRRFACRHPAGAARKVCSKLHTSLRKAGGVATVTGERSTRCGLTQDAMAAKLGFDGKQRNVLVYKWEAGITKPSHLALKMLERMARK